MIYAIIKCYLFILLAIAVAALTVLTVGFYWILRVFKPRRNRRKRIKETDMYTKMTLPLEEKIAPNSPSHLNVIPSQDITAIAGEDPVATQLDLACAYVESGRNALAKKILEQVSLVGQPRQQREAVRLLALLENGREQV